MVNKNDREKRLIEDRGEREAYFKKTTKSMMKKMQELTILCGIMASMIIYKPGENTPVIWPANADEVITRYENLSIEERNRKMLNQEDYANACIKKLQVQVQKMKNQNRQTEIKLIIQQLMNGKISIDSLDIADVKDVMRVTSLRINELSNDINKVNDSQTSFDFDLNQPAPPEAEPEI